MGAARGCATEDIRVCHIPDISDATLPPTYFDASSFVPGGDAVTAEVTTPRLNYKALEVSNRLTIPATIISSNRWLFENFGNATEAGDRTAGDTPFYSYRYAA